MKTTSWKQFVLISLPLAALQQVKAGSIELQEPMLTAIVAKHIHHDSLMEKTTTEKKQTIPVIELQPAVKHYVNNYLNEHDDLLDQIMQRNENSFTTMRNIFAKHNLPEELVYIAVVESKMKNTATSGMGAAGVWQLMPATARSLGLKVNTHTDQRRNIYYSTNAAASYIKQLYKQFNDWLLVVAAYNCGAGNVYKAIKNSGSRNFWKLQQHLPKESRDHVKRFIATHYYYEEQGSEVTLTKQEHENYLAVLQTIEATNDDEENDTPPTSTAPVNWVLLTRLDGEWVLIPRK